MRGRHPLLLFKDPHPQKSQDEIFAAINGFSDEIWPEDTELYANISAFFAVLPLVCEGRLVKGIMFSQAADLLIARVPWLKEAFFTFSYTMYTSFPWAKNTDGYLYSYKNAEHEAWFCKQDPKRAKKIFVAMDDTDFFHEERLRPQSVKKEIDVLCVARLDATKNLDMFARMLKSYREIYHDRPKLKACLVVPKGVDLNVTGVSGGARDEMRKICQALGFFPDYMFVASNQFDDMRSLYNRSRCVVLCSLVEGKNRTIHEAMSCDVPVVTFSDFNKFSRGQAPAFPMGAGFAAPVFSPESLATTIRGVLDQPDVFSPRRAILQTSGRRNMVETLMQSVGPYYRDSLPGRWQGKLMQHPFMTSEMRRCYQTSLDDFIFDADAKARCRCHLRGLESVDKQLAIIFSAVNAEKGFMMQKALSKRTLAYRPRPDCA